MELHRRGKLIGIQKYHMDWRRSPNISQFVHLPCDHKAQSSNQEEDSLHKNLKYTNKNSIRVMQKLSIYKISDTE